MCKFQTKSTTKNLIVKITGLSNKSVLVFAVTKKENIFFLLMLLTYFYSRSSNSIVWMTLQKKRFLATIDSVEVRDGGSYREQLQRTGL